MASSSGPGRQSPNHDELEDNRRYIYLSGLKIQGLPPESHHKYHFSISAEGVNTMKTEEVRPIRSTIEWCMPIYMAAATSAQTDMTITFELNKRSAILEKIHRIGTIQVNTQNLITLDTPECHSREMALVSSSADDKIEPILLDFTIEALGSGSIAARQNEIANEAIEAMRRLPHRVGDIDSGVKGTDPIWTAMTPAAKDCRSLLQKLSVLEPIVRTISDIHPYAKMAINIVGGVYKIILQQVERDQNIEDLLSVMNDTFDFIEDTQALANPAPNQKKLIAKMIQQTIDCGYFLQKYGSTTKFVRRLTKNLLSSVDKKIDEYKTTFNGLREHFDSHAILHTQISVVQILSEVTIIENKISLLDIPYANGARFRREKACLDGTRQEILNEISDWIGNVEPDVPRVYLLTGAAGTGKSAIAHSIAHRFHELHRLGSSFCFSRDEPSRTPDKLFSTLAVDLAGHEGYQQFMAHLGGLDSQVRKTRSIREQFEEFFLGITDTLELVGPILFLVDAPDESARGDARETMLTLLSQRTKEFPANFRFVITSRPEDDIIAAFTRNKNVTHRTMDDLSGTNQDIREYVRKRLTDGSGRLLKGIKARMCDTLTAKAERLFQWAYVACETIRADGKGGVSPGKRYHRLMKANVTGLDNLYLQILSEHFDVDDRDAMDEFRCVLGLVMACHEPLSISSLEELCKTGVADNLSEVTLVLDFMGSLLTGTKERNIPVKPLHTSFRDFLTDQDRSQQFYINTADYQRTLCLASLRVMTAGLRFDICGLKTSYLRNRDVPNLDSQVCSAISSTLSYSCRFWGLHLQQIHYDSAVHCSLKSFLRNALLYWLETLSLLGSINIARSFLVNAAQWLQTKDSSLATFSADGANFVNVFAPAIAASAPHTYLSGLPFAPGESSIGRHYPPLFQQTISIKSGRVHKWPALQSIMHGHRELVSSVAFSPDGRRVASGSADKTVRVWDVETGETVSGPYVGHEDSVTSVAFSPDGRRVASGSDDKTVRVWDVETGETVSGPYVGHEHWVTSVAFSPDGRRVASGSADKTVRVWDVETNLSMMTRNDQHLGYIYVFAFQEDGWVVGPGSELLFWVPPVYRQRILLDPRCKAIMGGDGAKLDYSRFVHGDDWHLCRTSK